MRGRERKCEIEGERKEADSRVRKTEGEERGGERK